MPLIERWTWPDFRNNVDVRTVQANLWLDFVATFVVFAEVINNPLSCPCSGGALGIFTAQIAFLSRIKYWLMKRMWSIGRDHFMLIREQFILDEQKNYFIFFGNNEKIPHEVNYWKNYISRLLVKGLKIETGEISVKTKRGSKLLIYGSIPKVPIFFSLDFFFLACRLNVQQFIIMGKNRWIKNFFSIFSK